MISGMLVSTPAISQTRITDDVALTNGEVDDDDIVLPVVDLTEVIPRNKNKKATWGVLTNVINDTITALNAKVDLHIADVANPHSVTKAQVGLGNADNTSDLNKPVSIATQALVDSHTTRTDNPHSVTQTQVGLSNVDNTSDINKPVSTATATLVSNHTTRTDNPHSVTQTQVGLGNVDNTSDANKPISIATAAAIAAVDADHVDLGVADNVEHQSITVGDAFMDGYLELQKDSTNPVYMGNLPSFAAYSGLWFDQTRATATSANCNLLNNVSGLIINATSGVYIRVANTTKVSVTSSKLESDVDMEFSASGGGIFLHSPDGTRYKLTVDNAGALSVVATP